MARRLRIELADAVYHVTSWGLERREIVCDDRDRRKWLELLAAVVARRRWRIFAWVPMGNHCHLLLQIPDAGLSVGMHLSRGNLTPREETPMLHPTGEVDQRTPA
jgi:putative transposase